MFFFFKFNIQTLEFQLRNIYCFHITIRFNGVPEISIEFSLSKN